MDKKQRTLVVGDVHGAAKALKQVLEKSNFNPKSDTLISLGDIADGWSETSECVDILLGIQEKAGEFNQPIFIRGNHDVWCNNWFRYGQTPIIWTQQGGKATIDSYVRTQNIADQNHRKFWEDQRDWYIDEENRLFIHAGWDYLLGFPTGADTPVNAGEGAKECHWDRTIIEHLSGKEDMLRFYPNYSLKGLEKELDQFKEVYIGHTATRTNMFEHYHNLYNLDTGCGWYGKLTIMDIDSKEYWQSDLAKDLYPEEKGRR